MKQLLLIIIFCILTWSCKPEPIRTEIAGYLVQFPINLDSLLKQYPNGHLVGDDRFVDSSQTTKVEWWFNIWGSTGNQNNRNQAHGVVIFLKNKDFEFDSVKTALEKRYKQPLKPLIFNKSKGNFSKLKPIYVCHINEDTFLVLTKPNSYRSEPHSLRIAVGYNLTKKEEEAFALLGGPIYNDKL